MPSAKSGFRLDIPCLQGTYLALNAVSDAFFLGDGPSGPFARAERLHGRHDLFSTLLSRGSGRRARFTGVNAFDIAGDFEARIARMARRLASSPRCGALFTGSMPMRSIAGTDHERVLREAVSGCGKPSFVLPRRDAVAGDWLDGYAGVLEVLAGGMDLSGGRPKPGGVAVVGHFMDRNEGDQQGNIRELERMLRALEFDPVSIWLSGGSYEDLRRARHAKAVVSLPHGRKAGRTLAGRLGARLVEAELPFGLEASRRFVEAVGRAMGRERRARDFIKRELEDVVPRLEWAVPHAFMGRRFAFSGDPHYAAAFHEQVSELGGRVEAAGARGAPAAGGVDLVVGGSFAFRGLGPGPKRMEFGYPSEFTHFLRDEPFLGFQGALGFLSRVANEVVKGSRQRAR